MVQNSGLPSLGLWLGLIAIICCQTTSDGASGLTGGIDTRIPDVQQFMPDENTDAQESDDIRQLPKKASCGHRYLLDRLEASNKTHKILSIDHPIPEPDKRSTNGRNLQSGLTYGPMSIIFDYRQVDKMLETSRPLFFAKYFIIKKNLQKVSNYISAYFKVLKLGKKSLPKFQCLEYDLEASEYEEDMRVTVFSEYNLAATYYAAASSCARSSFTNQPVAGIFFFNLPYMGITIQEDFSAFGTFLHEFFHVLGFAQSIFAGFPVPNPSGGAWLATSYIGTLTIDGVQFPATNEPNVLAAARTHFGCPTLPGVPLENEGAVGTRGSHYDKTFFGTEIMNPTVDFSVKVSPITVALLEGTKWYQIDPLASQDWSYGKNKGCDFLRVTPRAANQLEFCPAASNGTLMCSADFSQKSICAPANKYIDGDLLLRINTRSFCDIKFSFDVGSRQAFEASSGTSGCVEYTPRGSGRSQPVCVGSRCADDGSLLLTLRRDAGTDTLVCRTAGEVLTTADGSFVCPDVALYCGLLKLRCPGDCLQDANGFCSAGGKCFCFFGSANPITGACPEYFLSGFQLVNLVSGLLLSSILIGLV